MAACVLDKWPLKCIGRFPYLICLLAHEKSVDIHSFQPDKTLTGDDGFWGHRRLTENYFKILQKAKNNNLTDFDDVQNNSKHKKVLN